MKNGAEHGPELYSEMQRLISQWYGMDESARSAALPQLVKELMQLHNRCGADVVRAACHDCTEAA
jgi:N-methylhydantoinase B/oxoprolinase/acetone carboxylase alpha subunit